jgi:muramoyltetrapeptide carboxypeptidase
MVDLVDWSAMRAAAPKIFAGFSDVTVLHEAFARRLGVSTLYAPMVAVKAFVLDDAGRAGLREALFEPSHGRVLTSPTAGPLGAAPHLSGVARGVTVGGCVSLLSSNIGTPDGRTGLRDGILVIEDVEEEPYRMDRILTQLRRSGWLSGVAGIALGSWVDCGEPHDVRALMLDRLGDLGVPIVADLGFGHGDGPLTVPLGVPAELDGAAGTLRIL